VGHQYKKDTIQFLHIARGSIYELETLLNIAVMVEIINEKTFENFIPMIDDTVKLLNGLINYLSKAELK
jgi:four helix bundle protein